MKAEYSGYLTNAPPAEFEYPPRASDKLGQSAAFGCSLTFGIGVDEGQDWPSLLELYNLGRPGSSNDRLVRMAVDYILEYQPDEIFVLWTFPERREWLDDAGILKKFNPSRVSEQDTYWHRSHTVLSNMHADAYNLDRNRLLLHTISKYHQVSVKELNYSDLPWKGFSTGSDGAHPGADWHAYAAETFGSLK